MEKDRLQSHPPLTVLVTACGAQFMPGIVNCLVDNGERHIRLIGVDMEDDETLGDMYDCVYRVPKVSDPRYVDQILSICEKEVVNVLLPIMSAELLPLLDRQSDFDRIGTTLIIGDRESISICNNKLKLYEFLKEKHINTPKFAPIRKASELLHACELIGYPEVPVCVKATELSGSRGIRIIDPSKSRFDILFGEKPNSMFTTMDELQITLSEKDEMPEMMAMEYLPGEEGSVDLIADHGKIIYAAYRESNVNIASIPQVATLSHNEKAYKIACEVVSALGLHGSADLDFRADKDGNPILMEVNPRTAATMRIFKEGGFNILYLRIKQALGEDLPTVLYRKGIKMKRRYLEMFSE